MRAACRAISAKRRPHIAGSSKPRRRETCSPLLTMTARKISVPPSFNAAGGGWRPSNLLRPNMRSPVQHGFCRRDDVFDLGERELLEIGCIGHRHVLAGDPRGRRIEVIAGL